MDRASTSNDEDGDTYQGVQRGAFSLLTPAGPSRESMEQSQIQRSLMNYGNKTDDPCPCLCGCTARGGCCRPAPKLLQVDAQSGEVGRMNLLYSAAGCCDPNSTGLLENPPPQLWDGRVSPQEFVAWMNKLHDIGLQRHTVCRDICEVVCLVALPCFCPCWCSSRAQLLRKWNSELVEWQHSFNEQVLIPQGMFIKTQSRCLVTYDKDGKKRHIERWLAIAMNPEASAKLQAEPHLFGDVEGSCCGGIDEHELCVHP